MFVCRQGEQYGKETKQWVRLNSSLMGKLPVSVASKPLLSTRLANTHPRHNEGGQWPSAHAEDLSYRCGKMWRLTRSRCGKSACLMSTSDEVPWTGGEKSNNIIFTEICECVAPFWEQRERVCVSVWMLIMMCVLSVCLGLWGGCWSILPLLQYNAKYFHLVLLQF